jgi:FkbM family methyltransferase
MNKFYIFLVVSCLGLVSLRLLYPYFVYEQPAAVCLQCPMQAIVQEAKDELPFITGSRSNGLLPQDKEFFIYVHNPKLDVFVSEELLRYGHIHLNIMVALKNKIDEIKKKKKSGPIVIYDIGANIGFFSLFAASLPQVKVIAIEPLKSHFELFQRSLGINANYSSKVHLVVTALGPKEGGSLCMEVQKSNAAATYVNIHASEENCANRVPVQTLDGLVAQFGLPDIIKIDVEGYEPRVFEGGKFLLSTNPPKAIITEYVPFRLQTAGTPNPRDYITMLFNYGYTTFTDLDCFYKHTKIEECPAYQLKSLEAIMKWLDSRPRLDQGVEYFSDFLWERPGSIFFS